MRHLRTAAAVVALGLLAGGCATLTGRARPAACVAAGETLRLSGPTDAAMADCFRRAAPARRVELTSEGGSVTHAMEAAEILAGWEAEVVVVDYCESSCANYLLPVAREIVVRPRARIVLHGSIDGHMVASGAPLDLFERQKALALAHDIHPGWLLMRSHDDFLARRPGPHLAGAQDTAQRPGADIGHVIVEARMLRACLPDAPARWEGQTYADRMRAEPGFRRRVEGRGFFLSGALECAGDGRYPDP